MFDPSEKNIIPNNFIYRKRGKMVTDPIIKKRLLELIGKVVQVSSPFLKWSPIGTLEKYNPETGEVLIRRRDNDVLSAVTICLNAALIASVGSY